MECSGDGVGGGLLAQRPRLHHAPPRFMRKPCSLFLLDNKNVFYDGTAGTWRPSDPPPPSSSSSSPALTRLFARHPPVESSGGLSTQLFSPPPLARNQSRRREGRTPSAPSHPDAAGKSGLGPLSDPRSSRRAKRSHASVTPPEITPYRPRGWARRVSEDGGVGYKYLRWLWNVYAAVFRALRRPPRMWRGGVEAFQSELVHVVRDGRGFCFSRARAE